MAQRLALRWLSAAAVPPTAVHLHADSCRARGDSHLAGQDAVGRDARLLRVHLGVAAGVRCGDAACAGVQDMAASGPGALMQLEVGSWLRLGVVAGSPLMLG